MLLYNVAAVAVPRFRQHRLWTARRGVVSGGGSPLGDGPSGVSRACGAVPKCDDGQQLTKTIKHGKRTTMTAADRRTFPCCASPAVRYSNGKSPTTLDRRPSSLRATKSENLSVNPPLLHDHKHVLTVYHVPIASLAMPVPIFIRGGITESCG